MTPPSDSGAPETPATDSTATTSRHDSTVTTSRRALLAGLGTSGLAATTGTDRGTVVDHRSVRTDGTLITEAVLGPRYETFPPVLGCAFTGRLTTPNPVGESARIETRGRLRLRPE
jgi:hypothetical protein